MRPAETFIGQPIRSLQTMLRVIAEHNHNHPTVIPDGIYGSETVRAVSSFQRIHGIPVTGVTDQDTWEAVVEIYEEALIHRDEAHPLHVVLNPGHIIHKGDQTAHIYLLQAILTEMSEIYGSIGKPALTGILDEATADAIASFQMLSSLPMTGELDKHTWKHLTLQYPLAVSIKRQ